MVGLESQQIDRSSVSQHKNRFSISPSGECNFVRKCVSHTNYVWRRLKGSQGPCMLSKTCFCRRVRSQAQDDITRCRIFSFDILSSHCLVKSFKISRRVQFSPPKNAHCSRKLDQHYG